MRWLTRALLLLLVAGFAACSSFRREWDQVNSKVASSSPADRFSGAWEGRWQSASHRGPSGRPMGGRLRCVFTAEAENRYRAHFNARWLVFSSSYVAQFTTERRGRELHFRGAQDLGVLFGGVYRYAGRVTSTRFISSYDSRYDRGTFDMQRIPKAKPSREHSRD